MKMSNIYNLTDPKKHKPKDILDKLPSLHAEQLEQMTKLLNEYAVKQDEYDSLYKERLEYYMMDDDCDFDIQTVLKNKEDRVLYIKNSTEKIRSVSLELKKMKNKINEHENNINYLKDVRFSLNSSLEYQKFRSGQN